MQDPEFPSRREVLTGRVMDPTPVETHVSSLVVHVRHENLAQVRAALAGMPGIEIHAEGGGKLVVTLETTSEGDIVARLNEISLLDGVLSAALVFHHFEPAESPTRPLEPSHPVSKRS
jgi:periplasmic nitrate reductase NapD